MEAIIRRALPEDAEAYAACHVACWQEAYRGIISDGYLSSMSAERWVEGYRLSLADPGENDYFCVEVGGQIVGRLVIGQSRDGDKPAAGEIVAIYLRESHWGRGIGSQMMELALSELRASGRTEVLLWVLEANSRARRFYERHGFIPDGATKLIDIDKPHVEMRYIRPL